LKIIVDTDHRFYTRRAAEETALAARALTPAAKQRHEHFAAIFTQRAQEAAGLVQEPHSQST
jgi:hypothetical protein